MAGALNVLLIGCLLQGVQCQVFHVTVPQTIKVLRGYCVTIPCSFTIENTFTTDLNNKCKAIWKNIKNDKTVFDSTGTDGELRGKLEEKDCTTTLNNVDPSDANEYYLRLECRRRLKYDFKDDRVNILARDDPPRPILTPSLLTVKAGTSVSLNCSAPAPCLSHPPTLTWTPSLGVSQETLQENQDKTQVKTSILTFTASHRHHRQEISCTAIYGKQDGSNVSATSGSLMLNISFAPQILPSSDCTKTADELNCSCETGGNPPPTLQWYLDGLPVNHSDQFGINYEPLNDTGLRSVIIVNQPQLKDLSTLLCHSSNSEGSATQRFYVYRLEPQSSAESHVTLPVFILTVGVLTAALVCALLFAIRAQRIGSHNPSKCQCTENKMSVTAEEDIYANTNMMRKLDNVPNTHLGHQQVVSKSSEKKNEEGSDVIYSSVFWISKKEKQGEGFGASNKYTRSYLEEERRREGGMYRNYMRDALEMGSVYGNIVTGKDAKTAKNSEYAQVKFRDKNIMH